MTRSNDVDLTDRQKEVISQLMKGNTNKEIANTMNIEVSTVKSHIAVLMTKLGLNSRVKLALWGVKNPDKLQKV